MDGFKALAEELDCLTVEGHPLHSAVRYGVTQALLDAAAKSARVTMAEVVRDEYATGSALAPVPIFVQSGDDRHNNVDKMILKEVDVLPHGLINNSATKFGRDGEIFAEYVAWVRDRIRRLRTAEDYTPTLHFDLYGTLGAALDADIDRMTGYILRVEELAAPFQLRLEHPVDAGSRNGQVEALASSGRPCIPRAPPSKSPLTSGATLSRTSRCSQQPRQPTSSTSRLPTSAG